MGCASSTPSGGGQHHGEAYPKAKHTQPQASPARKKSIDSSASSIEVKSVEMTRETLERYVALEKQITHLEKTNVQKRLNDMMENYEALGHDLKCLEDKYAQAKKDTAKEKADVDQLQEPSVKQFFADQSQFDEKFSKEQEEYLDALNKQEIAQKEVDNAQKQREKIKQEMEVLAKENEELKKLYKEQDELLAGIFGGTYGSGREDQLEQQLDELSDRKQRVAVAKFKWTNARVLIQYACNQLAFAVKRWQEIAQVDVSTNRAAAYPMATEVRNNLVAGHQNITSAQRYLSTIQFPYCKPEEMETLTRATNNIYNDMQDKERHAHAYQCYMVTHKRTAALIQWFDMVIKGTIEKDLDAGTKMVKDKELELRAERLRLIKEKIRESMGDQEVDLDLENEMEVDDREEPEIANVAVVSADDSAVTQETAAPEPDRTGPTPLPDAELAPPPDSSGMLFGNIEELKKQHQAELEQFERQQNLNKTRMESGLQEKLNARRSRRARQNVK